MNGSESLTAWAIFKNLSYLSAFFLGLSMESFFILAVFLVLDTFLGVIRVIVVHGGTAFQSYRLVSGIMAKASIIMVPLVIAWSGKGVGIDAHHVASGILSMLILAQAYSILGNIHSIWIKRDVYEFDAISFILTRIQQLIEYQLKRGAVGKVPVIPDTNRDTSIKN